MPRALMNCYSIATSGGSSLPDGKTILPVNDVPTLLQCVGSDKDYTTIEQLIADVDLCCDCVAVPNSVNYLLRSPDFATSFCSIEDVVSCMGGSSYSFHSFNTGLVWKEAIESSAYFKQFFCYNVRTHTFVGANCFSNQNYSSNYPAKNAFNTGASDFGWITGSQNTNAYVGYHFDFAFKCTGVCFYRYLNGTGQPQKTSGGSDRVTVFKIQGSNDSGTTWVDVTGEIQSKDTHALQVHLFNNDTKYLSYRFFIFYGASGYSAGSHDLDFLGTVF